MSWNMAAVYMPLQIRASDAETEPEVDGNAGHEQAVLIGSLMVAPYRREPFRQAMLGDAVGNLASGFLGAVDIEGLAKCDGREHRCDGGGSGLDGIVRLRRVA